VTRRRFGGESDEENSSTDSSDLSGDNDEEEGVLDVEEGLRESFVLEEEKNIGFKRRTVVGLYLFVALAMVIIGFRGGSKLIEVFSEISRDSERGGDEKIMTVNNILEEDDDEDVENSALDYPALLHAYYLKHNPKRLGDVPMILERYSGREKELFEKMEKKYGDPVIVRSATQREGKHYVVENETEEGEEEEEEEERENSHVETIEESLHQDQKDSEEGEEQEEEEEEFEDNSGTIFEWEDNDAATSDLKEASRGVVKAIVVGFPGTGVEFVADFITKSIQWKVAPSDFVSSVIRSESSKRGFPEFNKFDQYQAISDDSASLFFEEIVATYPKAKVVLCVRAANDWIIAFKDLLANGSGDMSFLLRKEIYANMLGDLNFNEILWRKQYSSFYDRAFASIPRERRKVFSVFSSSPSNWEWLARFLLDKQRDTDHTKQILKWRPPQTGFSDMTALDNLDSFKTLHSFSKIMVNSRVDSGNLRVIGASLDGTGEEALSLALRKLGYSVAYHWKGESGTCHECRRVEKNFNDLITSSGHRQSIHFGFEGVSHGVDAIVGFPALLFAKEMLKQNHEAKVIVTVRRLSNWWREIKCRLLKLSTKKSHSKQDMGVFMHKIMFGTDEMDHEYLHMKKYRDAMFMLREIPASKILVVDLARAGPSGDAWRQICHFLHNNKCTMKLQASSFPSVKSMCS